MATMPFVEPMNLAGVLRADAENIDGDIQRLTRQIEEAEARIVDLRRRREEQVLRRVEFLTGANIIEDNGLNVRMVNGLVTVSVEPNAKAAK